MEAAVEAVAAAAAVVAEEEEAVVVVTDLTAHLVRILTRSASPAQHPRLAGEGR